MARPSRTPTQEPPLATTEPSSGRPMGGTAGLFNRAEPLIRYTEFRLPIQITGPLLVEAGRLSKQQTEETTGSVNLAERPMACWPFHLRTRTRELPLARTGQSSRLRTEEIPGLAKQVERPIILMPFHLLMQITERL